MQKNRSRRSAAHFILLLLPFLLIGVSVKALVPARHTTADNRTTSFALQCYDSKLPKPSRVETCKPNEVCYVEFYSMRSAEHLSLRRKSHSRRNSLIFYYDRFCVDRRQCVNRGLYNERCLSAQQLDPTVRKTFWENLYSEKLDPNRLVHSHFCCCEEHSLCNRFGLDEVTSVFNITIDDEHWKSSQKMRANAEQKISPENKHQSLRQRKARNGAVRESLRKFGLPLMPLNFALAAFLPALFHKIARCQEAHLFIPKLQHFR